MEVVDLVSSGEEREESSESEIILEPVGGGRGSVSEASSSPDNVCFSAPTSSTVTAIIASPKWQPRSSRSSTQIVDAEHRISHARAAMFVFVKLHRDTWPFWPGVVINESDVLRASRKTVQFYFSEENIEGRCYT